MTRAAIVLAAGRSVRMGQPKALLPVHGFTMLEWMCRLMQSACDEVIVVLGHDADRLRPAVPAGALAVENELYDRGMLSSLQTGIAAASSCAASTVLFTPVDLPGMQPHTVQRVAATTPETVVWPRYLGKRGHPVACGPVALDALRAGGPDDNARDILAQWNHDGSYIDVDDPGILADIDDPAAYDAFLKAAVL